MTIGTGAWGQAHTTVGDLSAALDLDCRSTANGEGYLASFDLQKPA